MAINEISAEVKVKAWFKDQDYSVRKGKSVDVEADLDGVLKHVAEVKGDQFWKSGHRKGQINQGARRNNFFMGLGQILVALTRHRDIPVSLALTEMYETFVNKYVDVLKDHRVSVLWVSDSGVKIDDLANRVPGHRSNTSDATKGRNAAKAVERQGHPDGIFDCRVARFCVVKGHLNWVKIDGQLKEEITSFAKLCMLLDIKVGANSAARVLKRHSQPG